MGLVESAGSVDRLFFFTVECCTMNPAIIKTGGTIKSQPRYGVNITIIIPEHTARPPNMDVERMIQNLLKTTATVPIVIPAINPSIQTTVEESISGDAIKYTNEKVEKNV